MKINSQKLKEKAQAAGVGAKDLAQAVARPGLPERRAVAAVANWMAGREQPRAKTQDVASLAQALGCQPKDLVRFVSTAKFVRSSPRKSKLLTDLIRGKRVVEAFDLLKFNNRRAAVFVHKALNAAVADAEQANVDTDLLVVSESRVDCGPVIKRFQPKDRGRAHQILKRTSHIVVGVEEVA